MKVAIYARVSTKTKGQDVENQLRLLRDYSNKMGYEVYQEYTDQESGAKPDRPAFNRLFSDAAKRRFDLLLFWSLDRFSREGTRKTIYYLQQLDDYGILYKSFTEQYLDSTGIFKDVIISILSTLAKQEQVRLSERVRAGLEKAKSKGRVGGRPAISKEIIDQICFMRQQGLSFREIGRKLTITHRTAAKYSIKN
jgi:DNA invertase Pin-like site-specific DNA recombinase